MSPPAVNWLLAWGPRCSHDSGRLAENGIAVVADAGTEPVRVMFAGAGVAGRNSQLVVRGFTLRHDSWVDSAVCGVPALADHTNSRTAAGAHVTHDLLAGSPGCAVEQQS